MGAASLAQPGRRRGPSITVVALLAVLAAAALFVESGEGGEGRARGERCSGSTSARLEARPVAAPVRASIDDRDGCRAALATWSTARQRRDVVGAAAVAQVQARDRAIDDCLAPRRP